MEPQDNSSASSSSSEPRRAPGNRRSDIWTFIRDNNDGTFTCLLCSTDSAPVWNTVAHTTFRRHLKRQHGEEYGGDKDASPADTRGARQTDLLAFGFERYVRQRTFDKAAADKQLVALIVANALSLSLVEKKEFRSFCRTLHPDYVPPTRKTVRKKIMARWRCEKELSRHSILQDVKNDRVPATTDLWTSAAKQGYMVVTMHWINDEWVIKSVMIGFTRVEYPHSGPRIAQHLIDTIRAMSGSPFAKLWAITTDNAANNGTMIDEINETLEEEIVGYDQLAGTASGTTSTPGPTEAAESQAKVVHVRCLAHVFQLAVKEGLKRCPIMDDSVGVVRDILKKLSESPSLLEALTDVCAALNVTFISPELDVVTRWNSTLTMISSARSLKLAIGELQRRIRGRHEGYKCLSISPGDRLAAPIPDTTWGYLNELIAFLRPIKGATTLMSGKNYPTFGVALVVFHLVLKHAGKTAETALSWYTKDFARAFKKKLDEYIPVVKTDDAQIAAILDPRAKSFLVKIDVNVEQVKKLVEAEYERVYRAPYEQNELRRKQSEKTQQQKEEAEDEDALYSLIDEHIGHESHANSSGESFSSELSRWLDHKDKSMNLKTDSRAVCNWMKHEAASFPRIQMMARDYLAVMATSVPSEEAFSASGTTITPRRARLADDAVTAIMELQHFLAFNLTSGDVHTEPVDINWTES